MSINQIHKERQMRTYMEKLETALEDAMEQKAMEKRVVDVMLRACTALGNPILETIGHDLLANPMEAANCLEGTLAEWNRRANKPVKDDPSPPEPENAWVKLAKALREGATKAKRPMIEQEGPPEPEKPKKAVPRALSQEEMDAVIRVVSS
jgi:hypothetical protein